MTERGVSHARPLTIGELRNKDYRGGNRHGLRQERLQSAVQRISKSHHKSLLIPYVIRGLLDRAEGRRLSPIQQRILQPILDARLADTAIRRFKTLPAQIVKAFDARFLNEPDSSKLDSFLKESLASAAREISEEIGLIQEGQQYPLVGGFTDVNFVSPGLLDRWLPDIEWKPPIPHCPSIYQLRMEYRGVTTHKSDDRLGGDGCDPYLIVAVYRLPGQIPSGLNFFQEIASPMKVKHYPPNLPEMGPDINNWSPSGGQQDADGNPVAPIQFYPKFLHSFTTTVEIGPLEVEVELTLPRNSTIDVAPLLLSTDLHLAVVSVWEEDADQSEQLLKNFSNVLMQLGSALMEILPPAGMPIVVFAIVLELVTWLTGSEDDPVGNFVVVLDEDDLASEGYREISARVRGDDNDWTIWLGVESQKFCG